MFLSNVESVPLFHCACSVSSREVDYSDCERLLLVFTSIYIWNRNFLYYSMLHIKYQNNRRHFWHPWKIIVECYSKRLPESIYFIQEGFHGGVCCSKLRGKTFFVVILLRPTVRISTKDGNFQKTFNHGILSVFNKYQDVRKTTLKKLFLKKIYEKIWRSILFISLIKLMLFIIYHPQLLFYIISVGYHI